MLRWVWILLCLPCFLQATEARLPRVAILPFGWAEDAGRDIYEVDLPGFSEPAGQVDAVDQVLWQHLPSVIKADWVERGQIQQMLEEQELQIFSSGNALRAGRWIKADVALVGIIRESKRKESAAIEYLDVDLSVVDLVNGETLAAVTWEPELVHRRHVAWPASSFEKLKVLCEKLLKEGLNRRLARQPTPKIVPLFFRNTSDVERLNFWEERIFAALTDKLPAQTSIDVLRFPGMGQARQEQELSLLGLTDANPDAWEKVGDYFIWGEYAEKRPDKPTEFQNTEVTFTWNLWDGGENLVTRTEFFLVGEAQAKMEDWLNEIASLVKAKRTEDKGKKNLDRVHAMLMERARETLKIPGKDGAWVECYAREMGDYRGPAGNSYVAQLLDLAAFFKPRDPACQFLRLTCGRTSNQDRFDYLDRFSGDASGQSLIYQGKILCGLGSQKARWNYILNYKYNDTNASKGESDSFKIKKFFDKKQQLAAQKHLDGWKAGLTRWDLMLKNEEKAGRAVSEGVLDVNPLLFELVADEDAGIALGLLEFAWQRQTLNKKLQEVDRIRHAASSFLSNEKMEDSLVRVLLSGTEEESKPEPRKSAPTKINSTIDPRSSRSQRLEDQTIQTLEEWRALPLWMSPMKKFAGFEAFAPADVGFIRGFDPSPPIYQSQVFNDKLPVLGKIPEGVIVGSFLVQNNLGLAKRLPVTGTDYAQLGRMLYVARENVEPAWINLDTGHSGMFKLEEGLPARIFDKCRVLDDNHILWTGYANDPVDGSLKLRRALWRVSDQKWIRLTDQDNQPESSMLRWETHVGKTRCNFPGANLWQGRIVYQVLKKAISPLTGETVDLGWILEKLPPSQAEETAPTPVAFTRLSSGWLVVRGNMAGFVDDTQNLLWKRELPGNPSRAWANSEWVWFEFPSHKYDNVVTHNTLGVMPYSIAAVSLNGGVINGPFALHGTQRIENAVAAQEGLWMTENKVMSSLDNGPFSKGVMNQVKLIPNPRKFDADGLKDLVAALPMQSGETDQDAPIREWHPYEGDVWRDRVPEILSMAGQGTLSQIREAIKNGASVSDSTVTGWTPLMAAAQRGDADVVKLLLSQGADPGRATSNGWTPIAEALMWGNYEIAALLVKAGAPFSHAHINASPKEDKLISYRERVIFDAPLWMLWLGEEDASIAMLDRMRNPLSFLNLAIQCGHTGVIRRLLEAHGREMTENQLVSIACYAWSKLDKSLAQAAVHRLPDPNLNTASKELLKEIPYQPVLGLALFNGDIESIKDLVVRGGRLTAPLARDQAFTLAVATKNAEVVRLVAEAAARADIPVGLGTDGGEALYQAVKNSLGLPMVEALLDAGISPLSKNRDGQSPPEWKLPGSESFQRLLSAGGASIKAAELRTNIDFIWQDDNRAAEAWLSAGPSLDQTYEFQGIRCQPLSAAMMKGSEKYLRRFLAAGADPNKVPEILNGQKNILHRTYLMEAAMVGRLDLLRVLVEGGAALRKRDLFLATARHLATSEECASYLRREEIAEREAEKLMKIIQSSRHIDIIYRQNFDDKAIMAQMQTHPDALMASTGYTDSDSAYYFQIFFASVENKKMASWIRGSGADLNRIQSKQGQLCLVEAVRLGSEGLVNVLLECGASPEAKGRNGKSAISVLDTVKDEKVRARLRDRLAQKVNGRPD